MSDKDTQIEELNKRIEQLERAQGFWPAFASNTLAGTLATVLGGVLLVAGGALWRNPDVLRSEAAGRALAVAAMALGFVAGMVEVYTVIQLRRSARWRSLDRRLRVSMTVTTALELAYWVLTGVLALLLLD